MKHEYNNHTNSHSISCDTAIRIQTQYTTKYKRNGRTQNGITFQLRHRKTSKGAGESGTKGKIHVKTLAVNTNGSMEHFVERTASALLLTRRHLPTHPV